MHSTERLSGCYNNNRQPPIAKEEKDDYDLKLRQMTFFEVHQ